MTDYRIATVRNGAILWRIARTGLSRDADCYFIYVGWRDRGTGEMSVLSVRCTHCGRHLEGDDGGVLTALPKGEAMGDHWHPWTAPCLDADADRCAKAIRHGRKPAQPAPEAMTMLERWRIDDLTCALVED